MSGRLDLVTGAVNDYGLSVERHAPPFAQENAVITTSGDYPRGTTRLPIG